MDELTALFEESDSEESLDNPLVINESTSVDICGNTDCKSSISADSQNDATNEMAVMAAEYEKLQKQMLLLQEKIKSKKTEEKVLSKNVSTSEAEYDKKQVDLNGSAEKLSSPKRSFCEAFGSALKEKIDLEVEIVKNRKSNSTRTELPTCPEKSSPATKSTFYPSQKKPRISHAPLVSCSRPEIKSKPNLKEEKSKQIIEMEHFSRIRLKKRFIDANDFKENMEGKLFLKPSLVRPTMSIAEDRDWVTIGVVAKHGDPQTAKNGKPFVIWQLSDLQDCTRLVSLFLFGKVYEELSKRVPVGTVVGLLNPTIMPPKRDGGDSNKNYNSTPALTIDVSERLTKIGLAADLGWCNATKYRNKQPAGRCLAVINKQFGEVCVFHMKKQHKKLSAKRGELQGTAGTGMPMKQKQNLWNQVKREQFYYGGQTYCVNPPSTSRCAPASKESKLKLTDILGSDVKSSGDQNQSEIERSKIMRAVSGIDEKQSLSGCSDKFAEMLASGDNIAGCRQFLNHLQKKKETEKQNKSENFSAADILKQQKELLKNRNKIPTSSSTSIKDISAAAFLKQQISSTKCDKVDKIKKSHEKKKSPSLKDETVLFSMDNSDAKRKNVAVRKSSGATGVKNHRENITDNPEHSIDLVDVSGSKNHSGGTSHDRSRTKHLIEKRKRCEEVKLSSDVTDIKPCSSNISEDSAKMSGSSAALNDSPKGATKKFPNKKTQTSTENSRMVTSQTTSELLQQMKRERYLNRKEKIRQVSNSQPLAFPSTFPRLGSGNTGNDVKLFDDWLIKRQTHNSASAPNLAELQKKRAIKKLRSHSGEIHIKPRDPNRPLIGSFVKASSNEKARRALEEKVAANRKDLNKKDKENDKNVKKVFKKLSEKEFQRILNATSSHQHELDDEEIERQESYFNPLIKKETMEMKMSETYEIPAKVVTCKQCGYTYWGAHERCKALHHDLTWKDVRKKFFECSNCKQRTMTWNPFPTKSCRECGSEKLWRRTCMWKAKDVKLESETLLLRGIEHSKFLNSIKSGDL